jgi:hypothetical protein
MGTADAADALAYAVSHGWIAVNPFGLTEEGKTVARHSRVGRRHDRAFSFS